MANNNKEIIAEGRWTLVETLAGQSWYRCQRCGFRWEFLSLAILCELVAGVDTVASN